MFKDSEIADVVREKDLPELELILKDYNNRTLVVSAAGVSTKLKSWSKNIMTIVDEFLDIEGDHPEVDYYSRSLKIGINGLLSELDAILGAGCLATYWIPVLFPLPLMTGVVDLLLSTAMFNIDYYHSPDNVITMKKRGIAEVIPAVASMYAEKVLKDYGHEYHGLNKGYMHGFCEGVERYVGNFLSNMYGNDLFLIEIVNSNIESLEHTIGWLEGNEIAQVNLISDSYFMLKEKIEGIECYSKLINPKV